MAVFKSSPLLRHVDSTGLTTWNVPIPQRLITFDWRQGSLLTPRCKSNSPHYPAFSKDRKKNHAVTKNIPTTWLNLKNSSLKARVKTLIFGRPKRNLQQNKAIKRKQFTNTLLIKLQGHNGYSFWLSHKLSVSSSVKETNWIREDKRVSEIKKNLQANLGPVLLKVNSITILKVCWHEKWKKKRLLGFRQVTIPVNIVV